MTATVKAAIINNMQNYARSNSKYQFTFHQVYTICREQFNQYNFQFPFHQKEIVELLTSYNQFDIYPERRLLVVRKEYPTIKDRGTLLEYLKERDPEGILINDRLIESYKGILEDINSFIETKRIRQAIINSNKFIYSMHIDIDNDLVSENPNMFSKKEYLRICKEEGANKVIKKENNDLDKIKKVKETRYNEWVEGYTEMKRKYEEEMNERRTNVVKKS